MEMPPVKQSTFSHFGCQSRRAGTRLIPAAHDGKINDFEKYFCELNRLAHGGRIRYYRRGAANEAGSPGENLKHTPVFY